MKHGCFLLGLVLFSFMIGSCATATPIPASPTPPRPTTVSTSAPTVAPTTAPVILKLEGLSGTKSLTLNDLKALPATDGWGGIKSSTGKITVPEMYKGVSLAALTDKPYAR
jgi:hypothetical protein